MLLTTLNYRIVCKYWITLAICIAVSLSQTAIATNRDDINFLTLSDIHFNPFLSCDNKIPCPLIVELKDAPVAKWPEILQDDDNAKPAFLEDTNTVLMNTALEKANEVVNDENAKFVVILGDFLGHHYRKLYKQYSKDTTRAGYEQFAKKTMQFMANRINSTFKQVTVLPLLGNNDSFRGDYVVDANGGFYQSMNTIWQPLLKNAGSLGADFNAGGYYAVDMPTDNQVKLIFLNSTVFSTSVRGKTAVVLARRQLDWLATQLQSAQKRQQRAILFMHIPEGVDIRITKAIALMRLVNLWKPEYIKRFQTIMAQHGKHIAGIVSSHVHMEWSGVLSTYNGDEISLYGVSSISPNLGNIPEFSLFTYRVNDEQLIDSSTYQIPILQR